MFHMFVLIIGLSGQPITILRGDFEYQTREACQLAAPAEMVNLQAQFDTSTDEAIKGKIAVADVKCATDQEMNLGRDA